MKEFIIFVACFILLHLAIVCYIIYKIKDYNKRTNGVCNYDPLERNFIYKTTLPKEEIYSLLLTHRLPSDPTCTICEKESKIRFERNGAYNEYGVILESHKNYNILRLNYIIRPAIINRRSLPSSEINIMIIEKLDAEPIPYYEREAN